MMQRLGIEPGGGVVPRLSPSSAAALRRRETCPSKQACPDWLNSMSMSGALAPRFCPNADIFFELQADRPGARLRTPAAEAETVRASPAHE